MDFLYRGRVNYNPPFTIQSPVPAGGHDKYDDDEDEEDHEDEVNEDGKGGTTAINAFVFLSSNYFPLHLHLQYLHCPSSSSSSSSHSSSLKSIIKLCKIKQTKICSHIC